MFLIVDISPLVEKWDDSNMTQDQGVMQVVGQLDKACREAGFFYVVIFLAFDCFNSTNTISFLRFVALLLQDSFFIFDEIDFVQRKDER